MKNLLLLLFLLTGILKVEAVYISEIMYDPQGSDTSREWIEIYNDTGSSINFTTWKFFEANTNHGLSAYSSTTSVSPSSYAIIADNPAKFLLDYPSFNGVLYDSSFSLSNSGELIILKDNNSVQIDSVNYSVSVGGDDDGSTLSFATSSFVRGKATPGSLNIEEQKATSTNTTTSSGSVSQTLTAPTADIILLLPETKTVAVGADSDFSVKAVTSSSRKSIDGLNYTWTFGDGGFKVGKNVNYHYFYPGNYTVMVKAENESYIEKGRIKVKVINPEVEIEGVGILNNGAYIDFKNKNNSEIDLSNWIIDINSSFYSLPENTIIGASGITRLSGRALGFSTSTNNSILGTTTIRILYPDHSLFTKFESANRNIIANQKEDSLITSTSSLKVISNRGLSYTKKENNKVMYKNIATTTIKSVAINNSNNLKQRDTRIVDFIKSWFR